MTDWLSIDKPAIEETAKTALITIRVTQVEKQALRRAAKRDRVSLSQFVINPALRKAQL